MSKDWYEDIYALKPDYETELGFWKLKWRPIHKKTYSFYLNSNFNAWKFGLYCYESGAHNGWNRSYNHTFVILSFWKWDLNFWIKWNYIVHKDGPSDVEEKSPLVFS